MGVVRVVERTQLMVLLSLLYLYMVESLYFSIKLMLFVLEALKLVCHYFPGLVSLDVESFEVEHDALDVIFEVFTHLLLSYH